MWKWGNGCRQKDCAGVYLAGCRETAVHNAQKSGIYSSTREILLE